jgi:transposase
MRTLLDLRGNIPSFIHISDGKLHDVHALDMIVPEAGAIYVMDRGYVDLARLHGLHEAGAFFVTRAKSNLNAHRLYSAATDRTTARPASSRIRQSLWTGTTRGEITRRNYGEFVSAIPKPGKPSCS